MARAFDVVTAVWQWASGRRGGDWERQLFTVLVDTGALDRMPEPYRARAAELGIGGLPRISDVERADRKTAGQVSAALVNEQIREGRRHAD